MAAHTSSSVYWFEDGSKVEGANATLLRTRSHVRMTIKTLDLDQLVRESDDFESFHQPNLFIYSFRYLPNKYKIEVREYPGLEDEINRKFDQINQMIADEIQLSGTAFVMTTRLRGLTVLRLSICSHRTTPEDIDLVFNTIREIGQKAELAAVEDVKD